MKLEGQTYESLTAYFAWNIPANYNIGVDTCDKRADGSERLALIYEHHDRKATKYSFDQLKSASGSLWANPAVSYQTNGRYTSD